MLTSRTRPDKKPMVIVPFSSKQDEWSKLEGIDIHNQDRRGNTGVIAWTTPIFTPSPMGT